MVEYARSMDGAVKEYVGPGTTTDVEEAVAQIGRVGRCAESEWMKRPSG